MIYKKNLVKQIFYLSISEQNLNKFYFLLKEKKQNIVRDRKFRGKRNDLVQEK